MKRLARHHLLYAAALSTLLFLVLAWFVPTPLFIELLNGTFLGMAVLTGIVWIPGLIRKILEGGPIDRVLQLFAGIACIWASVILQRYLSALYRYFGKPESWSDSIAWAVAVWIALIGAILHISASGTDDSGRLRDPERMMIYLGLPLSLAVTIAVLALR